MIHRPFQPLASTLFKIGAVKFGAFTLKMHETQPNAPKSPIFFNLRTADNPKPGPLRSPEINVIAHVFNALIDMQDITYDGICAIPNAGTPFAVGMQNIASKPLQVVELIKHEEGDKRRIDGIKNKGGLHRGARVLLIDDVVTGADTKLEAIAVLRAGGFEVHDLLVIVDREQGGAKILEDEWVRVHAIYKLTDLLDFYVAKGRIDEKKRAEVRRYIGLEDKP